MIIHVGFVDIGGHETSGDYKNVHVGFVDIGSHDHQYQQTLHA